MCACAGDVDGVYGRYTMIRMLTRQWRAAEKGEKHTYLGSRHTPARCSAYNSKICICKVGGGGIGLLQGVVLNCRRLRLRGGGETNAVPWGRGRLMPEMSVIHLLIVPFAGFSVCMCRGRRSMVDIL